MAASVYLSVMEAGRVLAASQVITDATDVINSSGRSAVSHRPYDRAAWMDARS